MMTQATIVLLVLLSFGTIAGQACTWAYDTNQIHVSDIQSTNDPNILLLSINDESNKERTVILNIRNQTFEEGSNLTIETFTPMDNFYSYANNYEVLNKTMGDNETEIILNKKLGSNIFVKTINDSLVSLPGFLVSEKLQEVYVLVRLASTEQQVRLLTTGLDNVTPLIDQPYTDVIGSWGINPSSYWSVNEDEQLLFIPAGCCYCVNGYYFYYNETTLYHVFTESTIAQHNLFDPRSHEFQVIAYSGKVTIYNYELNTTQNFTIQLSEIGSIATITKTINFGDLALLGLATAVVILAKKRKKRIS